MYGCVDEGLQDGAGSSGDGIWDAFIPYTMQGLGWWAAWALLLFRQWARLAPWANVHMCAGGACRLPTGGGGRGRACCGAAAGRSGGCSS